LDFCLSYIKKSNNVTINLICKKKTLLVTKYYKTILYHNIFQEILKLEKWSATSLRRTSLCADHFHPNSFMGKDKKKLKRDAIPIKFNGCSQEESETRNSGMKQSMQSLTQTEIPAEIFRRKYK